MSSENNPNIEIAQGGCLDALVKTATLGRFGIEVERKYGYEDVKTGEFFLDHPIQHVLKTGKTVYANYYINSPKLSRKIVRNK